MADVQTTIQHLAGSIGRLKVMLGATNFVDLGNGGLMFSFKGCRKANKCKVTLEMDMYNLEFYKIRGADVKITGLVEGLFFDQLKETFENETGLYLSL